MILFAKDWNKYPTAVLHLETTNRSFVDYASKLKKMGITNHAFPLALINPLLKNVDPHDSYNLSIEMKAMIIEEVKINPWYYFREIVRIPAKAGVNSNKLEANRGNISLYWCFFNHVTSLLIQPRQTGKSVSKYSLDAGILSFWAHNSTLTLLTKDDSLRMTAVESIKDIMSEYPEYLKLKTKKDKSNSSEITTELLGNKYKTAVGQASQKSAIKIARGLTTPVRHIDEFGFVNNIDITLPAMLAAGGAANDEARASGNPYGTIFTTTAAFRTSKEGEFAYNIYKKGVPWAESFFDVKNEEELVSVLKKNTTSKSVVMVLEFNHRQLGKTDEWLAEKMADAMSEGDDAEADFLNNWPLGSGTSPLDKDLIAKLTDSKREVVYTDITPSGYILRWFVPKDHVDNVLTNKSIVLSLDTSDAIGTDDIALTIRDVRTGETLGVGVFNETNTILFSRFIFEILVKFKKSVLIIERRSTGSSIIDNLILLLLEANLDPFKKLFNWVVQESDLKHDRYKEIDVPMNRRNHSVYTKFRKEFGYATSGSGRASRDKIYGENLINALKYTGSVAKDKDLINQISSLKTKNGRIDHDSDSHDDLAIAWLLGYWFLTNVKNAQFYGINIQEVLSDVILNDTGIKADLVEQEHINKQKRIKLEIDTLMDQLKKSDNVIDVIYITNRIKYLNGKLDIEISSSLNIETMLNELKTIKDKQLRSRMSYAA